MIRRNGEIFYQRGSCVGNGTVELIDTDFNMYRIGIEVEGCTENTVHAPGRFGLLNLYLRFEAANEKWYLFASGRNLADED